MAATKKSGNCYLCGQTLGAIAMKNHLLKEHASTGDEACFLLKIEGAYAKNYWLFVDVEKNKTLNSLDEFLRDIWLECCGHLSAFQGPTGEVGKARKLSAFAVGDKLLHEYDFGSTTECLLTIVGETRRPKQKKAVRLLARNEPPVWKCASCGQPAEFICAECICETENADFCAACAEEHEHEFLLPITNSPRSGVCGYDCEMDDYAFDPKKLQKK